VFRLASPLAVYSKSAAAVTSMDYKGCITAARRWGGMFFDTAGSGRARAAALVESAKPHLKRISAWRTAADGARGMPPP
jgi:hypothetical protein